MTRWSSDEHALATYRLIEKGILEYGLTEKAACQRIGFNYTSIGWLKKRIKNLLQEDEMGKKKKKVKKVAGKKNK